ncbi:MAG TPA: STM3941 family protein [Terracidiphilus sp.]|nr:STM3941 family protein [Terracidiphilus sp.]
MNEIQSNGSDIILRPDKRRLALFCFTGLGFVIIGVMQIARREAGAISWLCILFFGLGVAVIGVQLLPGACYLHIREDGFRYCSSFRKSPLILWQDVSDFRVARVPPTGHRMVVFDWHTAPNRGPRRLNAGLVGATDGLPDSYGLRPEELVDLLNAWRSLAGWDR